MENYNEIRLYKSLPNEWTPEQIDQWHKYWSIMGHSYFNQKDQYYSFGNGVPVEIRLGSLMWKFLKEGTLIKIEGIKNIKNFVRVTKAYLDSVYTTNDILDEDNKVIGKEEVTIRDAFPPTKENATHGLIRLTDSNWTRLEGKFGYATVEKHGDTITNYPKSIYSEKNYIEAIAEGGEFYEISKDVE